MRRWADTLLEAMPGYKRSKKTHSGLQSIHGEREIRGKKEKELFESGCSKYLTTVSAKAPTTDWTCAVNNQ